MFKKVIVFALLSIIIACDCKLKLESSGYKITFGDTNTLTFNCKYKTDSEMSKERPEFNHFKCKAGNFVLKYDINKNQDNGKESWTLDSSICNCLNYGGKTIDIVCVGKEVYPELEGMKTDLHTETKDLKDNPEKTKQTDICSNTTEVKNLIV